MYIIILKHFFIFSFQTPGRKTSTGNTYVSHGNKTSERSTAHRERADSHAKDLSSKSICIFNYKTMLIILCAFY